MNGSPTLQGRAKKEDKDKPAKKDRKDKDKDKDKRGGKGGRGGKAGNARPGNKRGTRAAASARPGRAGKGKASKDNADTLVSHGALSERRASSAARGYSLSLLVCALRARIDCGCGEVACRVGRHP